MFNLGGKAVSGIIGLLLLIPEVGLCQSQKSERASYGNMRASIMESLLSRLYPGARFEWNPDLRVEVGGTAQPVIFPGFVMFQTFAGPGGFEGATGIQLGNQKEHAMYSLRHFTSATAQNFATDLVVFEADASYRIKSLKKIPLDSADSLTEIKVLDVKEWPGSTWPSIRVQYESHLATQGTFVTIEWNGMLDVSSGKFRSRIPLGIVTSSKGGGEQIHPFTISRVSPAQVQVTDQVTKNTFEYQCSEPCAMDTGTLLSLWRGN